MGLLRMPRAWPAGWRALAVVAAAVLASTLGAVAAPSASAATCSGTGCNGLDPVQTGCGNLYGGPFGDDQRVSDLEGMYDLNTGAQVGWVWLDYSAACGTNWIEGYFSDGNPDDGSYVLARVVGTYGNSGLYGYGPVDFWYYGTGHAIWGNMIYSPGCAFGLIDRHNDSYSIHIGGQAVQAGCPAPSG